MKRFVTAAVCTFALVGVTMAADLQVVITKVDGSKVTYFKVDPDTKKKGDKEETATLSDKVKVNWGTKKKADITVGDEIKDWTKADDSPFTKIDAAKGVRAQITTDDSGKITAILAFKGKKKD
jgi:hypothetical protein